MSRRLALLRINCTNKGAGDPTHNSFKCQFSTAALYILMTGSNSHANGLMPLDFTSSQWWLIIIETSLRRESKLATGLEDLRGALPKALYWPE